ncbi:MAG: DASH family cryptochrome [Mucilaginibacter sp.]
MKKTAIVWFKTNLRLSDNECLFKAIAENDEVIPVYCLDDSHFADTVFGFKKTGSFRAQFLLEALTDLDSELRGLGSGLLILRGEPGLELFKLAQSSKATKVYAQQEFAPEEVQTEKRVKQVLSPLGCDVLTFECRNLIHPDDLPFSISQMPEVFTDFRKQIESKLKIRPVFHKPTAITSPPVQAMQLPAMQQLNLAPVQKDDRATIKFVGGASAAHRRLNYYFFESRQLSNYKETRNGMVGEGYSSKFSAWLNMGCISAKEIYEAVKSFENQYGANQSTYWLFFELLWRDFFAVAMAKSPSRYFLKSPIKPSAMFQGDATNHLNKWINGKTGVDFIDANMIELKLTGFMSNRGRQNVASYFCNDLKLDWRFGAAYFEQQLIDYDVCSNWGNWAYLAGVGNDPRANRYFNIDKQAATYDADYGFRNLWLNDQKS